MEKGDSILDKEIENLTINVCKTPHLEKVLIISYGEQLIHLTPNNSKIF